MAQTDRQTDKFQGTAIHWKSAIFDVDDNWSKLDTVPSFVKTVYRQKEICPTTQKPHFQAHIVCHQQQRISKLCSWIKATKWIPVKGDDHIKNSINYTSKKDTAVEGTHQVQHGEKYYQLHELLLEIAKRYTPDDALITDTGLWLQRRSWEGLTSRMVREDPKWANKLSNPGLKKMWDWWGDEFLLKVSEYLEETSGAYIIEGPADSEPPGEDVGVEALFLE